VVKVKLLLVLLCCWSSNLLALSQPHDTIMTLVIVSGDPGHSAIHLSRGQQQLYWDPGGVYGTEWTDCLADSSEGYCQRFAGFPWAALQAARHNDVLMGPVADLMHVISIYHLDGDAEIQVYTFWLTGTQAAKAWSLLAQPTAAFDTDRNPMFCVKGVTDYLDTLGGAFTGMAHPWFPEALGEVLAELGAVPSGIFSLRHPRVQQHIQSLRQQADLPPLGAEVFNPETGP